jgi:ferredoxin-NADP reductase
MNLSSLNEKIPVFKGFNDTYIYPIMEALPTSFRIGMKQTIVTDVRNEGGGITTLRLHLKNASILRHLKAGQHIELGLESKGKRIVRTFSISSSAQQSKEFGYIEVSFKVNANGALTPLLNEQTIGSKAVHVNKPNGNFTLPLHPAKEKSVFIAAGSGITPILAMLEEAAFYNSISQCLLLYYVKDGEHYPFKERLLALHAKGLSFKVMPTKQTGYFALEHLTHDNPTSTKRCNFFLCGPGNLIETASQALLDQGADRSQIFHEHFGLPITVQHKPIPAEDNAMNAHTVFLTRSNSSFNSPANTSLLISAENEGLTPNFGCRIGACHQCICRKNSGRVLNLKTGKVSDNGPEDIQLCISQAIEDLSLDI